MVSSLALESENAQSAFLPPKVSVVQKLLKMMRLDYQNLVCTALLACLVEWVAW